MTYPNTLRRGGESLPGTLIPGEAIMHKLNGLEASIKVHSSFPSVCFLFDIYVNELLFSFRG